MNVGSSVRVRPGTYVSSPMNLNVGYAETRRVETISSTALSVSVTRSAAGRCVR